MLNNIRHTGIVVRDLNKLISFYEGLGFSIDNRQIEKGLYIDKIVGLDNVSIETVKLKSPCGGLIELLNYISHPDKKKIIKQPSNKLGCSHIAISVKNLDKAVIFVQNNGGSIVNNPVSSPNGTVRVVYCHDPEGVLMELVEEI